MNTKFKKCPNCNQQFGIKSLSSKLNDNLPLFLKCGHSVCENCITNLVKFSEPIECKVCYKNMKISANNLTLIKDNKLELRKLFPVNIYMLGELSLECENKKENENNGEDCYINLEAIMQDAENTQDLCVECHNLTTTICQQCNAILCEPCFNKSHKHFTILKNHLLLKIEPKLPPNKCKLHIQKTLDYYCKDCCKSICMDCLVIGGEKSCKNHKLVSTQEINEQLLEELVVLSPKVEESFKRLTKTAVDIGNILHSIKYKNGLSYIEKMANEVEQHFSKLISLIQTQKHKLYTILLEQQNAEKESLQNIKNKLADLIKLSRTVLNAVNRSFSEEEMKQANMSVLLEDAKNVVASPWFLCHDTTPIKIVINEELCDKINNFISLEGDSNRTYKILATAELDPSTEIPPPPNAPVYPPKFTEDVREKLQKKLKVEKEDNKEQSFYKKVPTYHSKSGSFSSISSVNSESSYKRSSKYKDDGHKSTVSSFLENHKPKPLHADGQELVFISHIVTPHHFYVQQSCQQVTVEELLKEFRNAVSLPMPSISHVAEGKFYLVFNKTDNLWQRSQVISVDRKNIAKPLVHVFCIDFGSTEIVSIDKLRLLPPTRAQSPLPLAIRCSLSNCEPLAGAWTSDDAVLMQSITDNKQAVLHVHRINSTSMSGVSVDCDVTTFEHGVSLVHALVFHGRARLINTKAPYPKNVTAVNKPKVFINNNDFKPKTVEEVFITYIVSPDLFYVRKHHLQNVYEKLCEELEQNYSLCVNAGTIYLPEIDMVCVVNLEKYELDTVANETRATWARALIKELPGRGRVKVLLLDSGATVVVHWSALRRINPKFTTLRALATECHLSDVTPLNKKWSPNSVNLLQAYQNRLLELRVEDNHNHSLGVKLYDKTGAEEVICINTEMVKYKFAVAMSFNTYNKQDMLKEHVTTNKSPLEKLNPSTSNDGITIIKKTELPKSDVKDGLKAKEKGPLRLEAKVLHYQSPSLIYVCFVHQQKTFNTIFENIQKHYSNKKTVSKKNWKVGDKCCIFSQQSQTWRRAYIVEINDENTKVFYLDFAYVETLPISCLRELTKEFSSIGYAAVKCHLSGIVSANGEEWPSITKEYLKEMLDVYKRVFITKLGNFKDNSMPIEIWVYHTTQGSALEPNTSEWRCLNKKIIEQGLAIPDKTQQVGNANENVAWLENLSDTVEDWPQLESKQTKSPTYNSDVKSQQSSTTSSECELNYNNDNKTTTVFISDWLPPEPLQCQEFIGVPTYVDNDGIIYLHEISQQETLDLIRKALDIRFENTDLKANCTKWSIGEPCIALFYLDNKFYRGRILEINNDVSTCLVQYIDYGNEETCPFSNLRKCTPLYQIPTQVSKCKLSRIKPVGNYWNRKTLDYLHKTIVEKKCYIKITADAIDGVYPIDLKINKLCINDHLVEFEMAKYCDDSKIVIRKFTQFDKSNDEHSFAIESDSGPDYIIEDEQDTDVSYQNSNDMQSLEGKDWNLIVQEEENHSHEGKFLTFKDIVDQCFICNIIVINNFNTLELNIVHRPELVEQYEQMFEKLQQEAANMMALDGIFENKACVALFSDDGQWYRASILEYSDETNRIKVRYVDYGNVEIISIADVREIGEEFIKLPPLTLQATLHGIQVNPEMEVSVLTREFENAFLDKGPFNVQVIDYKNKIPCVELRNMDKELVYKNLIDSKIFLLTTD
ncbi:RING finger protein 17 [Battus philenor]|uniref:RING finger protein 17 n=1 Tax=Battus philenor TaxID=42288 RepID=UPI0035D0B4A0